MKGMKQDLQKLYWQYCKLFSLNALHETIQFFGNINQATQLHTTAKPDLKIDNETPTAWTKNICE